MILHELKDRLETSFLLSQHCLVLGPRTVCRTQFPAAPSELCCEHFSGFVPAAVSRGSLRQPAPAAAVAAAHARHLKEQYVVQVLVLKIAGTLSFLRVARSRVQYSQVAPCCL